MHRSLIQSKLDFGSIVYGSARTSNLNLLNPVAIQALRLCYEASRTSPTNSLQILAHEPPLQLRRKQTAIQYCTKLRSNPANPTYHSVFPRHSDSIFINKPNLIPPISLRLSNDLAAINIFNTRVANSSFSQIPPLFNCKCRSNTIHQQRKYNTLVVSKHKTISQRLPSVSSIFAAELQALLIALYVT